MREIQTRNHYTYVPGEGMHFDQPSLTRPNESMTVREIMTKYAQGMTPALAKEPLFTEESNAPMDFNTEGVDFKKLDLIDIQQIANKATKLRMEAEQHITIKRKEKAEKDAQEAREALKREWEAEMAKKSVKEAEQTH